MPTFLLNFAEYNQIHIQKMRKLAYIALLLAGLMAAASCNDDMTYADQKKRERNAIAKFVADSAIHVINEETFAANGYKTDTAKNEYVLFTSSGVYMQIIRQGCGEKIKDGETATVLCRFTEKNILTDSIQLSNDILYYGSVVDKMSVTNNSGTFTASFFSGESLMYAQNGSSSNTSVLSGWLVPLAYINIGRPVNIDDEIAKVKLIVPHDMGHSNATSGVYPCFYTITYERGR